MIAMLASSNAIAPMSREVSDLLCGGTGTGLCKLDIRVPIVVAPYHLLTVKRKQMTPVAARLRDLVMQELCATPRWAGSR